jgi:hypothetical protein
MVHTKEMSYRRTGAPDGIDVGIGGNIPEICSHFCGWRANSRLSDQEGNESERYENGLRDLTGAVMAGSSNRCVFVRDAGDDVAMSMQQARAAKLEQRFCGLA